MTDFMKYTSRKNGGNLCSISELSSQEETAFRFFPKLKSYQTQIQFRSKTIPQIKAQNINFWIPIFRSGHKKSPTQCLAKTRFCVGLRFVPDVPAF